ncbi:MMPL family transporter [Bacillus sp. FJAT-49711]|uniref:MMPL family transporter n=1 Tax=Bacillus sp. FJAT-49711 TaxID=2833585 RepID=UPI001BC9A780|nr:MMPL family transporter [Bacillus sp. FJAT-49711]MBS4220733.1 MMPL family transporter [Bacillus sp. FJAT-49711]
MLNIIHTLTDFVSSKKGMWITVGVWLAFTIILAALAPSARDYEVSRLKSFPDDTQSVVAQQKLDHYFKNNDGIPAILVFQAKEGKLQIEDFARAVTEITEKNIQGLEQVIPIDKLPPQALQSFLSKDGTTALLPMNFDASLDTGDIRDSIDQMYKVIKANTDLEMEVTGPAGISVDTKNLFSRADIVLILATVGIILLLLVVIYRSPALALIPLLAAGIVYEVVNQILGLIGKAGIPMGSQSLSIMSILLFAALIDYSLFVFSRYREELKSYESKYEAMQHAMRGVGLPVLFSGGTVLAAMLVLFFTNYGDSHNFAPLFSTTMVVVMIASVTLVPALFAIFGRKAFWPLIPKVGDSHVKVNSIWSKVGHFIVRKPVISVTVIGVFLLLSASNIINTHYEFDTLKSFPKDMPSRVGYEILEEKFEPGDLAPTTVLVEAKSIIGENEQKQLSNLLANQKHVANVRLQNISDDEKAVSYSLTFDASPYSVEAMDALEVMMNQSSTILRDANVEGKLYFTGETATSVDDRSVNNRDLKVVITLETLLIFSLLIFLTKSIKMPIYMMGTILISYVAALGLGMFLTKLLFGIDTINNRVPMYAFVFLVALGVDYNIMLVSRFMEERKHRPIRKAVEIAVSHTGGVISSAGLILAATFAVLTTQPIELLFVFGFIVAVGILMDTFLIRGILLPGLIVLLEKDKKTVIEKQ